MPELPEVEIVKQSLLSKLKNKKISKVSVFNRNLRYKIEDGFEKFLKNQKIINITRKSKFIILHFTGENYCILHLGMSGTLHLIKKNNLNFSTNLSFYKSKFLPKKHNHILFYFSKFKLFYNDPRRFGFFKLIKSKHKLDVFFEPFNPEALDKKFNLFYLKKKLKNKSKNIKNFLLDQKFVSGIGNIYASEILFASKINPFKKAKRLNKNECLNIILNSKKILKKAIKKGGSSIRDFQDISGNKGTFQKEFRVYQQDGGNCKRSKCKGIIKKKITSNRSTFFCVSCQK